MSKKNKFNGLHVDKDQLPVWIEEFSVQYFSNSEVTAISKIKDTQHRCRIIGDGSEVMLDFFFSKDGKTSMLPIGKNREASIELAEYIYGKIPYKNEDVKSRNYSIEGLEKTILIDLIEYLNQLTGVNQIKYHRNDQNTSDLWQFTSQIGDKITLIYYDKKKLHIQGKPLYLYNEVTVFLSAFIEFDEVIKNQNEFLEVEVNPTTVKEEMRDSLPFAYQVLGENLKKILAGSFALQKFDYPFEDYSPIAFPALKTLEGYLKSVLIPFDILVKKNFGGFFQPMGIKHVLIKKLKDKINNDVIIQVIEKLYAYLHMHRHTLFHTGTLDADTRIIETRQEADLIVTEVLALIENSERNIQSIEN